MLMEAKDLALVLLGLALTVVGLGVVWRTGRDVKEDNTSKLNAAWRRSLEPLRSLLGLLIRLFGGSLILSICSGMTLAVVGAWVIVVVMEPSPHVLPTRGANYVGYVGQALPDAVEVLVQRHSGVPEDAKVVFAPMRGHGTTSPDTADVDSTGRVRTAWTLGNEAGEQQMKAKVVGGDSVWIIAKARDTPVAKRIKITPDSAVLAFAGDVAPFSATILDQHGDPFPGSVAWSSKKQCIFEAGSYGFATALGIAGTDSIVAVFDTLRATALVRVKIDGR